MSELERYEPSGAPTERRMAYRLSALDRVRSSDLSAEEKVEALSCELHTHYAWTAGAVLFLCESSVCPGYTWGPTSPGGHPHPCANVREYFTPLSKGPG